MCGLTNDFNSEQEICFRKKLNKIGDLLGVKFIVVEPSHRCQMLHNMLCWPHNSYEETIQTYNEIKTQLGGMEVAGFIGFFNGEFFLNKLSQFVNLDFPVISIGAAGFIQKADVANKIYLLIGTQDYHHFELTKKFAA